MLMVLIPTWNGRKWIGRCLESVLGCDYEGFGVEVIDNASTDGTVELVERTFPGVSVLRMERNVGFAAAVNVGIHRALEAKADGVVLLNQDTWAEPDWLTELVGGADAHGLDVASPMQYRYEGDRLESEFARLLVWHGYDVGYLEGPVLETKWVIGAAMFIRSEVIRTVGSFDENYFFYAEELDFCRRAMTAVFRIGVVTTSRVRHHEKSPEQSAGPFRTYHRLLGDYLYRLKSPSRPLWWLVGGWVRDFVKDFWEGVCRRRGRFLVELLRVQVSVLWKLPAIARRRRQEHECPHTLW